MRITKHQEFALQAPFFRMALQQKKFNQERSRLVMQETKD
jgi:hypothetical protein